MPFFFSGNDIFIPEKQNHKTLNIEFWIDSTHGVKSWNHFKLLDYKIRSIFLKQPV